MADKEVNIIIAVKNMVGRGIDAVKSSIASFSSALKDIALGAVTAAAALTGMAAKAVQAFAGDDASQQKLIATIKNVGGSVDDLLPKFAKLQDELMTNANVGDDVTREMIALGLNMGIAAEDMEYATKAAVGLARAYNMDLETAMRLVGKAAAGNTDMLQRQGIELENATTPQEKFAALLEKGAEKYGAATEATKSFSGQLEQMRMQAGEAVETIGETIVNSTNLGNVINFVSETIVNLRRNGKLAEWVNSILDGFSLLKPAFDWLAKSVQGIMAITGGLGAFAGTLFGGGSIKDAMAAFKEGFTDVGESTTMFRDRLKDAAKEIKNMPPLGPKVAIPPVLKTRVVVDDKQVKELKKTLDQAQAALDKFRGQQAKNKLEAEFKAIEAQILKLVPQLGKKIKFTGELNLDDKEKLAPFLKQLFAAADRIDKRVAVGADISPQDQNILDTVALLQKRTDIGIQLKQIADQELLKQEKELVAAVDEAKKKMEGLGGNVQENTKALNDFDPFEGAVPIDQILDEMEAAAKGMNNIKDFKVDLSGSAAQSLGMLTAEQDGYLREIRDNTKSTADQIKGALSLS